MHVYIYLCLAFTYMYASAAWPAGSSPFRIDATTFNSKVFTFTAEEFNDLKVQAQVLTPLFEACKVTFNNTVDQCKSCVGQHCQSAGGGDLLSNAIGFVEYYGNPGNYLVEPLEDAGMSIANFATKYGSGAAQAIVGAFNTAGQEMASFFEEDVMNSLQATLNGITLVGEQIGSFSVSTGNDIANAFNDFGGLFGGLGKRRRRSASDFVDAHAISRQTDRAAVSQATRDCYNNNCPVCEPFLLETSETVSELCPAAAAKNVTYVAAVTKFQNIFSFFNNTDAPNNELVKDVYISSASQAVVQATGWFPPGNYTTYVPTGVMLQGFDFVSLLNSLAVEYHGRVHNMV